MAPARGRPEAVERQRGFGQVEAEHPFERREPHAVGAEGAIERVAPAALDQGRAADEEPGLGAAEQLVAAAGRRGRSPAAISSARLGWPASCGAGCGRSRPLPSSTSTGTPARAPELRELRGRDRGDEPDQPEVAGEDLEQERRSPARPPPRSRASRVRLVAPTSTRRAPAAAMISGMRNEPPISTSSPRDTTTSRPCGERRQGEHQRRGVVVDHQAASAAGERA